MTPLYEALSIVKFIKVKSRMAVIWDWERGKWGSHILGQDFQCYEKSSGVKWW